MLLEPVQVKTTARGLDDLIAQIEGGGVRKYWEVSRECLAAALEQLEFDDRFDGTLTDEMVDTLVLAEEVMADGQSAAGALNRLLALYNRARRSDDLERMWRGRVSDLTQEQLETELWLDLQELADLFGDGDLDTVEGWLEETAARFQSVWERYESDTVIFDEEITSETVLCHHFLKEGAGLWLEALLKLQSGQADLEDVIRTAEQGQRLLVTVQVMESELNSAVNSGAEAPLGTHRRWVKAGASSA